MKVILKVLNLLFGYLVFYHCGYYHMTVMQVSEHLGSDLSLVGEASFKGLISKGCQAGVTIKMYVTSFVFHVTWELTSKIDWKNIPSL